MSFLNPILLFGLGAVAAPIVIHLLNRRKFQKVVWGAMRFIKTSVEQTRQRSRLEDFLLLLLRCLLLALLALTLARPALKSTSVPMFGAVTKSTAVLLLDNSMSMGLSDGAERSFDRALRVMDQTINGLAEGSSAALVLISDIIQPVIPEPSLDLNLVRKMARESLLSDRGTELLPALAMAVELLNRRSDRNKEIYLITDGQAEGWKQWGEIEKLLRKTKNIRTHVILVGQSDDRNLAVSSLTMASGLSPSGQSIRFEVQIRNWGREPVHNVPVALHIDQEPAGDEFTIDTVPAGSARSVSLFARFRREGFHSVTAVIPNDRLMADNRRSLVVKAFKEMRVLLVDGDPGNEPRESEIFFLKHAMQPVARSELANYFLKPTFATPNNLGSVNYNDFDAVVLANVPALPPGSAGAFKEYVKAGGGLIIFPGDRTDIAQYNRELTSSELLPARLGPARGSPEGDDKFFTFQSGNYQHPVTAIWNDPAAGTLASARIFRACELLPLPENAAAMKTTNGSANLAGAPQIVLRFADGKPAVMERSVGLGEVFLFATSADTAWNDFPVRPAFVPFLHRVLGSILERRHEGLTVKVGETLSWRAGADFLGKEAIIYKPGNLQQSRDLRSVEMIAGWPSVQFEATDLAGLYEISISGAPEKILFAAQPDANESNLQSLSAAEMKSLATLAHVVPWSPQLDLREKRQIVGAGSELWLPFLLGAIALTAVETFFSFWFSRPK